MREFLMMICPYAIWGIVAGEVVIAALLFSLSGRKKSKVARWSGILTLGLILDAAIIGLGSILTPEALETVSPVRFIAHGLLIPLLFPICGYALNFRKPLMFFVWTFTLALMIAGVLQAVKTVLVPETIANVTRMKAGEGTPKWAEAISRVLSFGTVIPMMIAGVIVWIKEKTPHLFLSGFFMFAFSALGPATGNTDLIFFISMFGEILMVLFLYLYARAKAKRRAG
ncbi:MAG: hypothetical protein Q4B07_07745 [Clostridia bacterium]|nr:hypothetical protein [Clostridia bacterium]